jgi:hypothetical protein
LERGGGLVGFVGFLDEEHDAAFGGGLDAEGLFYESATVVLFPVFEFIGL